MHGTKQSALDVGKLRSLFADVTEQTPRVRRLVIGTDSADYDAHDWAVFGEVPPTLTELFLEFDICNIGGGKSIRLETRNRAFGISPASHPIYRFVSFATFIPVTGTTSTRAPGMP